MTKKWIVCLLCSTFISTAAFAGLEEGLKAFDQKKYEQALEEFTYLADEGNNIAAYHLGMMYEEGLGVEPSTEKAAQYYLNAYNTGNTLAATKLGRFLIEGKGVEKNVEDGLNLLKTAGRSGDKEALFILGEIYKSDEFKTDYVIASAYYKLSALQGYAQAQYQLALLYLYGRGVPQDYSMALKWMGRSAAQGYVPAQKDLADLLKSNPRMMNYVEAYAWYSIIAAYNTDEDGAWAAERRDELATLIKDTKNLIIAQQLARNWKPTASYDTVPEAELAEASIVIPGFNDKDTLRQLEEQNVVVLADGSEYGIMADDVEQAIIKNDTTHLEEVVTDLGKNGKPDALTYWGKIVEYRLQKPDEALKWYTQAADYGDAEGAFYVARSYCEGKQVDASSVQCYKWLSIAKQRVTDKQMASLMPMLEQTIAIVEPQISPEEKEQALKEAEEFKPVNERKKSGFRLF